MGCFWNLDEDDDLREAEFSEAKNILEGLLPWVNKDSLIWPLEVELSTDEKKVGEIIETVISSETDKPVLAIPIIGEKIATTIAQRVYHDRRIQHEFDIRHWVCMGEMVYEHSSKLLDLIFRHQTYDVDMLKKFISVIRNKRYLLILDGTTQADLGKFLSELLSDVKHGSKIILTASSLATLGNLDALSKAKGAPFELGGEALRKEDLSMFERIAIKDEGMERDQLLEKGKEICNKFAAFPHLLKLIASFLSSKHTIDEWGNFHDCLQKSYQDLSKTNLLKFNLRSHEEVLPNIEQCKSYCSLFPKDYEFNKNDLIHLWDSQEYLQNATESPEELVGEEYFGELHKNNYFVENTRVDGVVQSYKMQYLVHELLKGMAKSEFRVVDKPIEVINDDEIRHLSFTIDSSWKEPTSWKLTANKLESLLFLPKNFGDSVKISNLEDMLKGLTCLRALDLVAVNCETFPSSLGELQELRYLRLGVSSKTLPQSVTRLQKLQTLDLRHSGVIELPKDFHKLTSLRHLYTRGKLRKMPPNFGELKSLRTLDFFIVREKERLESLVNNLAGKLTICYDNNPKKMVFEGIPNDMNLEGFLMQVISSLESESESNAIDDRLHCLQPCPGLRSITICRKKEKTNFKKLVFWNTIFNGLSSLHIEKVDCECLSGLSTLPHLRSLHLWDLNISYAEDDNNGEESKPSSSSSRTRHYFPSLEYVMLANLPNFKAWSQKSHQQQHPICSRRLSISVSNCSKLISMPPLTSLVSLEAHTIDCKLLEHLLSTTVGASLKKLEIISVAQLGPTFSITDLKALQSLAIKRCPQLKELALGSSKSLQQLEIHECYELVHIKCLSGEISFLETLEIKGCEKLELINSSEGRVWKGFNNLRFLKLISIFNLQSLESALYFLENLEGLFLHSVYELRDLPAEYIWNHKKLHQLSIRNCPFLLELPKSLDSLNTLQCDIEGKGYYHWNASNTILVILYEFSKRSTSDGRMEAIDSKL
ncbi:putative disease resistance protein RGA3 [Bienertia sinuspersici]